MSITFTTPAAREAQLRAERTRAIQEAGWATDAHRAPVVRRGARVLGDAGTPLTGTVEGFSYGPVTGPRAALCVAWPVVRWSDGMVTPREPHTVVAVDASTVLVEDEGNNVNRLCNVRGDGAAGEPVRCWLVVSAVSGRRYLVKHVETGEVRVVSSRYDMTNLY